MNNDHTRTCEKDSESDSKSDIDIYSEEMIIVEQCILLCLGCYSGDVNTVKLLLKYVNKAALNMHIKNWFTNINPLIVACTHGYSDSEQSHLSISCTWGKGHLDITKELIKAGADVNKGNAFCTPLLNACKNNNLSAVRLLIKVGANLNLKAQNKTPLQVSFHVNNWRIADELIKAGANANSENGVHSSTKASCNEKSVNNEKQNNANIDINPNQKTTSTKYTTPLIIACENGDYLKVKLNL